MDLAINEGQNGSRTNTGAIHACISGALGLGVEFGNNRQSKSIP